MTDTLFSREELAEIRSKFYCVDQDMDGSSRLFFDNAGCSEYSTPTARYPEEAEQAGIKDRGHNAGAPFRL